MLEQVGQPRAAWRFVFRPNLVPNFNVGEGNAVVDVEQNFKAVR